MMKTVITDRLIVAANNEESVAENDITLLQLLLVVSNLWIKMFTMIMILIIVIMFLNIMIMIFIIMIMILIIVII